jgi:peptidoglycan hydrolase-like protein with peptidoglycan-binding domain
MLRKIAIFATLLILTVSLSGCATARRQKDLESQGLRNQISVLEAQIQSKDDEINNLRGSLGGAQKEESSVSRKKVIAEVKSRPNVKQIQTAIKNAGYNPGPLDGKMGKQTRDAIQAFQRANDLAADGKVGKQTWALLKEYLYKKVK